MDVTHFDLPASRERFALATPDYARAIRLSRWFLPAQTARTVPFQLAEGGSPGRCRVGWSSPAMAGNLLVLRAISGARRKFSICPRLSCQGISLRQTRRSRRVSKRHTPSQRATGLVALCDGRQLRSAWTNGSYRSRSFTRARSCDVSNGLSIRRFATFSRNSRAWGVNAPPVMKMMQFA